MADSVRGASRGSTMIKSPMTFGEVAECGDDVEIVVTDVRHTKNKSFLFGDEEYVEFTLSVDNGSDESIRLREFKTVVRTGPEGFAATPTSSGGLRWEGVVMPGRRAATRAKYVVEPNTTADVEIGVFDERESRSVHLWQGPATECAEPEAGGADGGHEPLSAERRAELRSEALAELDVLIGLAPVKRQVRLLVAQCRMAELRRSRGLPEAFRPHHLVFAGPPGTGKTTVARIVGKLFAGLGLLDSGHVIEAQRGDLVGKYVGHTAEKTGKVVDSALDGVLFIDEAYALSNTHGRAGDRDVFGDEALQVLLTRAENDRDRLVVVLAGYRDEIDGLLATNPGLASRFNTRIDFPDYTGQELAGIARVEFEKMGQRLPPAADRRLVEGCRAAADGARNCGVGNGRFIRTLVEYAVAQRDLRLAESGHAEPSDQELTTVGSKDIGRALDELLGVAPIKRR